MKAFYAQVRFAFILMGIAAVLGRGAAGNTVGQEHEAILTGIASGKKKEARKASATASTSPGHDQPVHQRTLRKRVLARRLIRREPFSGLFHATLNQGGVMCSAVEPPRIHPERNTAYARITPRGNASAGRTSGGMLGKRP